MTEHALGEPPRRVWEIPLPYDAPPLSLNQRLHWAKKSKITKELRMIARARARHIPDLPACAVELVWFVKDRRRRDTDNPVPTLKALCDGLVDAEVVPDDTPEYMHKRPVQIIYRPSQDAALELRVYDTDASDRDGEQENQ